MKAVSWNTTQTSLPDYSSMIKHNTFGQIDNLLQRNEEQKLYEPWCSADQMIPNEPISNEIDEV